MNRQHIKESYNLDVSIGQKGTFESKSCVVISISESIGVEVVEGNKNLIFYVHPLDDDLELIALGESK